MGLPDFTVSNFIEIPWVWKEFARASSHLADFNTRNKLLIQNFLNKDIRIINFANPFLNFMNDTMI